MLDSLPTPAPPADPLADPLAGDRFADEVWDDLVDGAWDARFGELGPDALGGEDLARTEWSRLPPSGLLLDMLDDHNPGDLDDWQAVETIVACERLAARVAAVQAAAAARLADLRGDREAGYRGSGAEVAAALRLSSVAAGNRVAFADALATRLPGTRAALYAGDITAATARAIWEATTPLDGDAARRVEDHVLRRAGGQTAAQLRECLRRAVLKADPDGADRRHRTRKTERRVEKQPLDDGMGSLWAYLTGVESCGVYTRLTDLAYAMKTPDDGRSVDERRADALVALCLGRDPLAGVPGANPAPGAHINVTVGVGTLLGLDNHPAELAGYGPIPADLARELAADATWRRLLTDPAGGALLDYGRRTYRPPANLADFVRNRDVTCRFPGCRQPAQRCDLDHVAAWPAGPTAEFNLGPLCRRHHQLKQTPGWHVRRNTDGSWTWTAPTGHTYETPAETYGSDPPDDEGKPTRGP